MSDRTTPKAVVLKGRMIEEGIARLREGRFSMIHPAHEEGGVPVTVVIGEEVVLKRDVEAMLRKLPVQAFVGEPVVRVQDIEDFFAMHGIHVSDPPTT